MRLGLDADGVLTTTRSVRKRLDLEKRVEREVIEECLDIALQAPTGSNTQGWQWVFVTDPEKNDLRTSQRPKIMDSSRYLREIFHEVPVMMIPCIQGAGRLDTGVPTFGQASAWGSLLPAVWSFMLALRERGLGSAWTTLHLPNEREVAELLGIPYDTVTQGGLFPIAYTKGTDFKLAKRLPGSSVSHWDEW